MIDGKEKLQRELKVFNEFIERSKLPIDLNSVQKRNSPEPDMLCNLGSEGLVAFELKEICDETVAKTVSHLLKTGNQESVGILPGNPVPRILTKIRTRYYKTEHPIELLLYTAGRIVLPPDVLIPMIQSELSHRPDPRFQRVWFMGESGETCECVIGI